MRKVKEFVIKRSEWMRGPYPQGVCASLLYNKDDGPPEGDHYGGKLCCVGIYGRALGIEDTLLRGAAQADDLPSFFPEWLVSEDELGYPEASAAARYLYDTNDSKLALPWEREESIRKTFAEHGIEVTFVD